METEVVSFDPDSDLQLILTTVEEQSIDSLETASAPTPTSDAANQTAARTDDTTGQVARSSDGTETEPDSSDTDAPTPSPSKKEIRFLVSSKHMILASPVFKAMLQPNNFKEGVALSKGAIEVPLPDDEPASWKMILDVIHHNTCSIPHQVDLQTMTKLAVLVDKYQLGDLLFFHARIWVNKLDIPKLEALTPDLVSWFCISWVFKLDIEFQQLTRNVIQISTGNTENDQNLPIPDRVWQAIETHRQNEIKKALDLIDALIKRYQGPTLCCSTTGNLFYGENARRACDGTILGTLLQSAAEKELYPLPKAPYHGLSFNDVTWGIRKFKIASLCRHKFPPKHTAFDGKESHGVHEALSLQAQLFYDNCLGIDLSLSD